MHALNSLKKRLKGYLKSLFSLYYILGVFHIYMDELKKEIMKKDNRMGYLIIIYIININIVSVAIINITMFFMLSNIKPIRLNRAIISNVCINQTN